MRKFELFEDAVGRVIVWCKDMVHVSILLFCCYFRVGAEAKHFQNCCYKTSWNLLASFEATKNKFSVGHERYTIYYITLNEKVVCV